MITNILIKGIASYGNNGVAFNDLQKVNFIFGANGTGKTTFSRVLADQALWSNSRKCRLDWDGTPMQIMVYNKDYKAYYLSCYPDKYTLSEGEATLAAFENFVQKVEEKPYPKVVVIDDPISSLDYEGINRVSTLTNSLIRKARKQQHDKGNWIEQVFILTHNATYHKSLSVNQARRNTCYWKLYKRKSMSFVMLCGKDNPVHGDYEELWQMVRSKGGELRCGFGLPTVMRRIAEIYFLQYGAMDPNMLLPMLVTLDESTRRDRQLAAFRHLFVTLGHEAHYNMMMKL